MNRSLILLLTFVVLAHSLVGCCHHHAHAAAPGKKTSCCTAHGHSHSHGQSKKSDDQKAPAKLCCEASCVFVRGDGPVKLDLSLMLALDCWATASSDVLLDSLQCASELRDDAACIPPPARLHLLHQILLI